jgi:hypothetical protein
MLDQSGASTVLFIVGLIGWIFGGPFGAAIAQHGQSILSPLPNPASRAFFIHQGDPTAAMNGLPAESGCRHALAQEISDMGSLR